jgi:hypothetical protein
LEGCPNRPSNLARTFRHRRAAARWRFHVSLRAPTTCHPGPQPPVIPSPQPHVIPSVARNLLLEAKNARHQTLSHRPNQLRVRAPNVPFRAPNYLSFRAPSHLSPRANNHISFRANNHISCRASTTCHPDPQPRVIPSAARNLLLEAKNARHQTLSHRPNQLRVRAPNVPFRAPITCHLIPSPNHMSFRA